MKQVEFNWQIDNVPLFAQEWQPAFPPKAVVCLVHGLGEHSGRYEHVAAALNAAGYAVLAFDLPGHGRSGGQRGHVHSFDLFLDAIAYQLDKAMQRFPGRPCFLYGHSLGSILVINYVLRRRPQLAGVIVTGTALRSPLEQQKAKVGLARLLGRVAPTFSMSTGLDANALSRDPAVVEQYKNDPLVHGVASTRMAVESLSAAAYAREHMGDFYLPLLMMHGSADSIALPGGSTDFAPQVPGDCTCKVWEGCYHEVHNEPEKEQVLAYLIEWLDSRVPGAQHKDNP